MQVAKLTNNDKEFDNYKYSGYGIGFDVRGSFSLCDGSRFGKNIKISSADMSSSVHSDNKKRDILILGNGTTNGFR